MSETQASKLISVADAYKVLRERVLVKLKVAAREPSFADRYLGMRERFLKQGVGLVVNSATLADLNTPNPVGWDLLYAMGIGVEMGIEEIMPERELFTKISQICVESGLSLEGATVSESLLNA